MILPRLCVLMAQMICLLVGGTVCIFQRLVIPSEENEASSDILRFSTVMKYLAPLKLLVIMDGKSIIKANHREDLQTASNFVMRYTVLKSGLFVAPSTSLTNDKFPFVKCTLR